MWSGPIRSFLHKKKIVSFEVILKIVELIELLYELSAVHCTQENSQGSIYIYFIVHYKIGTQ